MKIAKFKSFAGRRVGSKVTQSLLLGATAILPFASGSAAAQEADKQESLEEIVVTAQRREQAIEQVPISITAFNAATLKRDKVDDIEDYFTKSPNVNVGVGISGNESRSVSIRGVSNIGGASNAFTIYVDEFAGISANPNLYDVERVEVLRGPQGTYFGRNSTGGALNITTTKPKPDFGGEVELGYGRFNTLTASGFLNVPLSDKILTRVTGQFERSDGFVKNLNPNGAKGDTRDYVVRGQVRLLPTERLTVDLQIMHEKTRIGLLQSVPTGVVGESALGVLGGIDLANLRIGIAGLAPLSAQFNIDPASLPITNPRGFYPSNRRFADRDAKERVTNNRTTFLGKLAYDFDWGSFTSISGYQKDRGFQFVDVDGTSIPIATYTTTDPRKLFTQELRLSSKNDGKFGWTVGGYFSDDNRLANVTVSVGPELATAIGTGTVQDTQARLKTRTLAAFVEAYFKPVDTLTITIGGRYTREKIQTTSSVRDLAFPDFTDPVAVDDFILNGFRLGAPFVLPIPNSTFKDFSPRLAVSYDLSDTVTTYAVASNGFKAGGAQFSPLAIQDGRNAFQPEDIWNYEVGLKGRFFDNTLRFSLSAFLMDWKDLQVSVEFPTVAGVYVAVGNAASARSKGIEAQFEWVSPIEGLRFDGGVGFLDAKFGSFKNAVFGPATNLICRGIVGQPLNTVGDPAPDCDVSGQRLPRSPKWTVNLGAEYRGSLNSSTEGFVRLDMTHVSSSFNGLTEFAQGGGAGLFPDVTAPRTLFNYRSGIESDRFGVDVYVENLFDKKYFSDATGSFLSGAQVVPGFRTFGVRARAKF
jgi:iron complex outermembrane recepter protein